MSKHIKQLIEDYLEDSSVTSVKLYYNHKLLKSFCIKFSAIMPMCRELKKLMQHGDVIEIQSTSGETITMEKRIEEAETDE